uniref:B30.2/SPRY domain-containing protein n=1 Tax=Lepisosteus oculatus TaxID=7918 RepID=W5NLC5_LEPOC
MCSSLQSDACQFTLDPNTAHRQLCLSEGNRRVTWSREPQQYPDHPERFNHWQQVLCREGLSGTRCYWEMEWRGIDIDIGVTYKGLSRKGEGDDCRLGLNDQSWSLCCSGSSCSFWHNKEKTAVAAPPSSRIGVYVDHRAGTLSFYSVSGDTATLLHRVQASFTEPLYPGVGFGPHVWFVFNFVVHSVSLCEL